MLKSRAPQNKTASPWLLRRGASGTKCHTCLKDPKEYLCCVAKVPKIQSLGFYVSRDNIMDSGRSWPLLKLAVCSESGFTERTWESFALAGRKGGVSACLTQPRNLRVQPPAPTSCQVRREAWPPGPLKLRPYTCSLSLETTPFKQKHG